jgi:NAD(P)-dependent dehydrogenase (short-subunit alcohol dehydrogenase family)
MARIAPTADSTYEEWERVTGINLRGVWSCMKYELRQMERQGSGQWFIQGFPQIKLVKQSHVANLREAIYFEARCAGINKRGRACGPSIYHEKLGMRDLRALTSSGTEVWRGDPYPWSSLTITVVSVNAR